MGACQGLGCGCTDDRREIHLQKKSCRTFSIMPSTDTQSYNNINIPSDILDPPNGCDIKTCTYISKVIKALKYYHGIDIIKNQMEFIKYTQTKCNGLIEYFHHILFVHSNDIAAIYNLLLNEYDFMPCKLKKCNMAYRNLRDRRQEDVNYDLDNNEENSIELTFWIDFFDSIHCYLLHLRDYGYCITAKHENNENENNESKEGWEGNKDPNDTKTENSFAQIKEYVLEKRKKLKQINAHRTNISKFNLSLSPNTKPQKTTKRAKKKEPFIADKLSQIDMNIGHKFYYWDHFKTKKGFVAAKYKNLKDELLNNSHYPLDLIKYKIIFKKAQKMFNLQYIRSRPAEFTKDHKYGISAGTKMEIKNVFVIVLYVDYGFMANSLIQTFYGESAENIKQKHKEFVNWTKLLRETVDYFGIIASEFKSCFVGSQLGMCNSLSIRLRAPTSISQRCEVAMCFVDDFENGMILELKHNKYGSNDIKGFPCNFLSNFCGEEEWLMLGGKHTLKVFGLRILKNNADFGVYYKALHWFDLMLSGKKISNAESLKMNDANFKIINDLVLNAIVLRQIRKDKHTQYRSVAITRRKSNYSQKMDENVKFMQHIFDLYCLKKETIVIDLYLVKMCFCKYGKLIMSEFEDNLVLFNRIGLLFENVKQIGIYALDKEYAIDLHAILLEINNENCSHFERIQIRCNHNDSWLQRAWSDQIKRDFYKKEWIAHFVKGKTAKHEDVFVVQRK